MVGANREMPVCIARCTWECRILDKAPGIEPAQWSDAWDTIGAAFKGSVAKVAQLGVVEGLLQMAGIDLTKEETCQLEWNTAVRLRTMRVAEDVHSETD